MSVMPDEPDELATDDVPDGVDAPTEQELADAAQFFKDLDATSS